MERKISLIIFIIICSFILIGCSISQQKQQKELENNLISAIEKKRGNDKQVIIKLNSLTNFQWDKFYIFLPYSQVEDINKTLGFVWVGASKSTIDVRDGICLLVFVRDNKVVQYLEYPRNHGDFSEIDKPEGFTPEETVFEVREVERGEPWLVLYEITSPAPK